MRPPILLSILLLLQFQLSGQITFKELTEAANVGNLNHKNHGIAFGDFDNDGDEDIYAFTRLGENKLYENLGNNQFVNIAPAARVHHDGSTRAAVWGDINNDGLLDLYVCNYQRLDALYLNNGFNSKGEITFTNISQSAGILNVLEPISAHMADLDNDGWLDIYVANFKSENRYYRNNGDLTFTDLTRKANLSDKGNSMGCVFFDYDNDGDQDLYLVHDFFQPNILYQNDGKGIFENVASEALVDYEGHGMGVDIADINNDRWMDLYITDLAENVLFLNQRDGTFLDISESAGVADLGMGWGTIFQDFDNDGWKDIYVVNDFHYSQKPNALFLNNQDLTFEKMKNAGGTFSKWGGIGGASADLNQDGFYDIMTANTGTGEGNQLFINQGNQNNWIVFQLIGTQTNTSAIGATVQIEYGNGEIQRDQINAGSGFAGQNSLKIHFGLGEYDHVNMVSIFWPSGQLEVFENLTANEMYQFHERSFEKTTGSEVRIDNLRPNPFSDHLDINLSVPTPSIISIHLINAIGQIMPSIWRGELGAGIQTIKLNTKNIPVGYYFLRVDQDGQTSLFQTVYKNSN